ncbi:DUF1679 domain-containing protein [Bacillus sp. FJAT-49732]|uniref:DUF1679 domain-containing protein n=1 Tax=Lederbergia citrisecunda TaxID=2833583 RepID=A0A942TI20_9BACI|nr:DUF1679 domain-containing protein [Lederbergia citrisecunda]MBS4198420.1 DUF1679 domain-containing protein [Lederbergia citrisecunda]
MEYTYLLTDYSLYINVESNVLNLMYFLFFRANSLNFHERKTNIKVLDNFVPLLRVWRVLEITYLFYRRRKIYKESKESFPSITTPFYGHCLMVLRLGEYKIINFKEKDVTTVFPDHFTISEIENNIRKLLKSQECVLAPRIKNWNINLRYIKECYINLKKSQFNYESVYNFNSKLFPVIETIMFSTDPIVIPIKQYVQSLTKSTEKLIKVYWDTPEYNNFLEFYTFIKTKLMENSIDGEVLLVLSHGDIWEGNILTNKKITSVIDWNTINMRSCNFDLYFILFYKAVFNNNLRTKIVKELISTMNSFQIYLVENNNYFSTKKDMISQSDINRYLFYLEFILLKLQEYPKSDVEQEKFLGYWIDVFMLFEKVVKPENTLNLTH